jgi:protein HIRA/HIR1
MSTISLDAPVAILAATGKFLLAITTTGSYHTWNILTKTSLIPSASIAGQITAATGGVTHAKIYENGVSLITLSSGISISWDPELSCWVRLNEPWWQQRPPTSSGHRPRTAESSAGASQMSPVNTHSTALATALSLGALETNLHVSRLLGSKVDYRAALLSYARRLADDNLAERADEIVRELCGPVFW